MHHGVRRKQRPRRVAATRQSPGTPGEQTPWRQTDPAQSHVLHTILRCIGEVLSHFEMITELDVPVSGGSLRCLAAGRDEAPVALCLHGFPDFAPSFGAMLEALAKHGYRAVAPFLRGYAPSVLTGPYDLEAIADDVMALADGLSPRRPIAIVGHDWGSAATTVALARAPSRFTRAVTLAVPHPIALARNVRRHPSQLRRSWYMGFFQLPWLPERAIARDDFAFVDRLWHAWSPGYRAPADTMRALKRCLAASMPAPIGYYRAITRPPAGVVRRSRAFAKAGAHIDAAMLLLMGAQDGCVAAAMANGNERFFARESRVQIVDGAGHFLHLERTDEVHELVLAWLGEASAVA
jgi:pimeloyl-ACP methyl ester carboxylesterase